jgi:hypothetical protein
VPFLFRVMVIRGVCCFPFSVPGSLRLTVNPRDGLVEVRHAAHAGPDGVVGGKNGKPFLLDTFDVDLHCETCMGCVEFEAEFIDPGRLPCS